MQQQQPPDGMSMQQQQQQHNAQMQPQHMNPQMQQQQYYAQQQAPQQQQQQQQFVVQHQAPPPSYSATQQQHQQRAQMQQQQMQQPHQTVLEKSPLWAALQGADATDTILCAQLAREVANEICRRTGEVVLTSRVVNSANNSAVFNRHVGIIDETLAYCRALFDKLNELVGAVPDVTTTNADGGRTDEWIASFIADITTAPKRRGRSMDTDETTVLERQMDAMREQVDVARAKMYDLSHEANAIQWYMLASKTPTV